jgi:hypothetical protein
MARFAGPHLEPILPPRGVEFRTRRRHRRFWVAPDPATCSVFSGRTSCAPLGLPPITARRLHHHPTRATGAHPPPAGPRGRGLQMIGVPADATLTVGHRARRRFCATAPGSPDDRCAPPCTEHDADQLGEGCTPIRSPTGRLAVAGCRSTHRGFPSRDSPRRPCRRPSDDGEPVTTCVERGPLTARSHPSSREPFPGRRSARPRWSRSRPAGPPTHSMRCRRSSTRAQRRLSMV